jgi:hypothetical protein
LPSKKLHEWEKRCADFVHLNGSPARVIVGWSMATLIILVHVAVHSRPPPDMAARATEELRSTRDRFNEADGVKSVMYEVGRPSACVVFQKRKKSDDGHTMGFLPPERMHVRWAGQTDALPAAHDGRASTGRSIQVWAGQKAHRLFVARPEDERGLLILMLSNSIRRQDKLSVEFNEPFDLVSENVETAE